MGLFGFQRKKMREKVKDIKGIPIKTPEELAREFGGTPGGYEKAVKMMTNLHKLPHMIYKDILGKFYEKEYLEKTIRHSMNIRGLIEPDRKASPGHIHDFYRDIQILNTVDYPAVRLAFPIMTAIIAADELLKIHRYHLGWGVREAFKEFYYTRWKEKHAHRSVNKLEMDPEDLEYLARNTVSKIELKTGTFLSEARRNMLQDVLKRAISIGIRISNKVFPGPPEYDYLKKIEEAFSLSSDPVKTLKENGIDIEPELEEFRQFLAEISGKKIEPKKPKYPETKKAVEEELRKAGIPEERVEIIAPRLATAVWLENQIRALKESGIAKTAGGVPVIELRNLREKVLAKKHVAEKAVELVEREWMRGNITPITTKHFDERIRPLVKDHAIGMLEDIKNLAERVKRGELDLQDVRNILAIERDLLDRTHEAIERTLGSPKNLIENKKAYGVEDRYFVKKEVIKKMHEELKPHFETARVKILKKK